MDYDVGANELLSLAVERDAEGYLADEKIADVAAHRKAEDAQVEQDDGDDDGNDDGGDGGIPHPVERPDAEVDHDADDDDDEGDGGDDVRDEGSSHLTAHDLDYDVCTNKLLSSAVERDAEGYLADEEIADVAAHREAEDAQVEQDDGDDDGNDDGGDYGVGREWSPHCPFVSWVISEIWINNFSANKLLRSAVERDAEGYLADEEIADVAAHREAEDAQVEQDDGDDDGNDDSGDGLGGRGRNGRTWGIGFFFESSGRGRVLCTGDMRLNNGGGNGRRGRKGLAGVRLL
ncbi:hypothetical protein, conserved [Babesia bigemina]|uniref:Uncharacterized protein n=1 Tax=Babesia bigemina TaxID=5866 RepID=A0A061BJY8_BABBI|nr:hypothetical protein, conserved [Babesia bigemina]CDR71772.1 hypothetical protein, conserved [Babesia bigemina]|eukprot:XP_012770716.1 hypothetical protein, conserved [Babesia bigemina]